MHISRDYSFQANVVIYFLVDLLHWFVYAVKVNRDFYAINSA